MPDSSPAGRTQYYTAATLDGFIADPDHSLDWLFQFTDAGNEDYPAFIADVGAIAMGSNTYEWVLDHIAQPDSEFDSWPYTMPAWIFSTRTLPAIEGADIRFVKGDVGPVHADMIAEAAGKNVWLVGGGDLVGQFFDKGLLDDLIVTIASVTIGAGKPLLPRRISHPPLRLESARAIGTSFVQLRYTVPKN
jgi:dihydrofolate reductase